MENLISVINELRGSDEETLIDAFDHLRIAWENVDTVDHLEKMVIRSDEAAHRQYAGILLSWHFTNPHHWQQLREDQRALIKSSVVSALINEKDEQALNGIAQLVGTLLRNDPDITHLWMDDILRFLHVRCRSVNSSESEMACLVFVVLAVAAPKQFQPHLKEICQMCDVVLVGNRRKRTPSSVSVQHIIEGMNALVPFISGHDIAEATYERSLSSVVQCLRSLSTDQPGNFCSSFEILSSLLSVAPKLLSKNLRELMVFCLETTGNKALHCNVRLKTAYYATVIVLFKKKVIVKKKMVAQTISAVFKMVVDGEKDNLEVAVIRTLRVLALYIPSARVIPPLIACLKPALSGNDALQLRAAYLSLAVIAEGCASMISNKYFDQMFGYIQTGIANNAVPVRNAAFYALCHFATHLQPKISETALQLMPTLLDQLAEVLNEIRNGGTELNYADHFFYALETYCGSLGTGLLPYLPVLMEHLCTVVKRTNSPQVSKSAFSAILAVAHFPMQHLNPHYDRLMNNLPGYFRSPGLRTHAIDAVASIVRNIGVERYSPPAIKAMRNTFILLSNNDGSDIKRRAYNLVASLASVGKEKLATIIPPIRSAIYSSAVRGIPGMKQEDLSALKEFAQHTVTEFLVSVEATFEKVYDASVLTRGDDAQIPLMEALTTFVLSLFKSKKLAATTRTISRLMPRLAEIVASDIKAGVVQAALRHVFKLLRVLKHLALPTVQVREQIFTMILTVMLGGTQCQFKEVGTSAEEWDMYQSDLDVTLIEAAGNVLQVFGSAMEPAAFNAYYERIHGVLSQKYRHFKQHEHPPKLRVCIYDCIGASFEPLDRFTANYFDIFLPILSDGMKDKFAAARRNAIFGLGVLVFKAEPPASAYRGIASAFSNAARVEKTQLCSDAICGAVARVIMSNYSETGKLVVYPFSRLVRIREDFKENVAVFQCFKMLYTKNCVLLPNLYELIITMCVLVLTRKQFPNEESAADAKGLLLQVRDDHPEEYEAFLQSHPKEAHLFREACQ